MILNTDKQPYLQTHRQSGINAYKYTDRQKNVYKQTERQKDMSYYRGNWIFYLT
jgi:hypothetical protein